VADTRRALPSVDALLREPALAALAGVHPRALVVRVARELLAAARRGGAKPRSAAAWAAGVAAAVGEAALPTLRRCINATGVVLHTNLGRAPLAPEAVAAISGAAAGYGSLELDLESGRRGSRHLHCAALVAELTGAADAMVVNNAAAALLLALAAVAEGGDVIVSRGELIEIGGGFRIPEIMEEAGVSLVEVGTTNRTRPADYQRALDRLRGSGRPLALLKVHRSNFRIEGFAAEVSASDLAALGRRRRIPLIYDLGGGLMTELADAGLHSEPTVRAAVRSGAALTVCSGDKLLGGPQAGIVAGSRRMVAACRGRPLARAVRADKLTLAGLAATLELYRDAATARDRIPVLRMLTAAPERLREQATALAAMLPPGSRAETVATSSVVGGGTFPGTVLPGYGVAIEPEGTSADELARRLRSRGVPIIATVQRGRLVLDVRTLLPGDELEIATALRELRG
jgi:L-seryl-tRNA(Ser) seleniumtransferase